MDHLVPEVYLVLNLFERTLPFFIRIINTGDAHSELLLLFQTPMFTNLLASVLRDSTCNFGIGNGSA